MLKEPRKGLLVKCHELTSRAHDLCLTPPAVCTEPEIVRDPIILVSSLQYSTPHGIEVILPKCSILLLA